MLSEEARTKIKGMFRALRYRNFRLFFIGQGFSLVGTWMQQMAIIWLVYRLTDSVFLLGAVTFASQIPTFIVGPFAGVAADRLDRRKVLILVQSLSMVQAVGLAALIFLDVIHIWHVIVLSALLGIINAFEISTRQAFVVQMVDKREDVSNAVALNSSMFNMAWLVGPSIAGILTAAVGEGMVFLINAGSYLAVIISLVLMRVKQSEAKIKDRRVWKPLKEGFKYAFGFPPIRALIANVASVSLFGMPFIALMPAFARDILHGNANTLGYLMGASGVGAFIGALFLAQRKSVVGLGHIMVYTMIMFSIGLMVFSFSQSLAISLASMLFSGFGMIVTIASCNTLLHTIVEDDKRGRIMSLYTMAIMGMAPLGSLIAGSVASYLGVRYTLAISGFLCGITVVPYAVNLKKIRKLIKPIYQSKGILPEIAKGLESATHPPSVSHDHHD